MIFVVAPQADTEESQTTLTASTSSSLGSEKQLVYEILGLKTSEQCEKAYWSSSISYLIGRLFRLSKLIAKSTTTDRHARAEAVRDDPFDNSYDIAHLQHKFPKLAAKPWLLRRLGEANGKRRNFFRYCRTHREKLAAEPSIRSQKPEKDGAKSAINSIPKTFAKTSASTVGPVNLQAVDDAFDDPGCFTTAAISVTEDQVEHALSVPSLASVAEPGTDFECPYCLTIAKFNGQRGFR